MAIQGIWMRLSTTISVGLAVAALVLLPVSSVIAKNPRPTLPTPTASEFAVNPPALTIHPGEAVPIQSSQKAFTVEIARLARAGHASAVEVDAATGTIGWVTAIDNATFDPSE
jgi:hypothetical protein